MSALVTIIIPTFNNPTDLVPCVNSIIQTGELDGLCRLLIVNNGRQTVQKDSAGLRGVSVIEAGENLGWEGGIKRGVAESDSPFIVFQNDDTLIPRANAKIYQNLLIPFHDPRVGAVGPVTTTAAGVQSLFHPRTPREIVESSFLIFFTVMVRRAALEAAGGIDDTLPGGDDFDLCIRLRKAGYKTLINPGAFLLHHGFRTGTRVRGGPGTPGGWNSREMSERTHHALIQKHGFKTFFLTMCGAAEQPAVESGVPRDKEGDMARSFIQGETVVELGCGGNKTVAHSIGVDRAAHGEKLKNHPGTSAADVTADVAEELPFPDNHADTVVARHIFEHLQNPVAVLRRWRRIIKPGGRLIIAVPDNEIVQGIPLNPEHLISFTRESLKDLVETCGFREIESKSCENLCSFIGCFEKVPHA